MAGSLFFINFFEGGIFADFPVFGAFFRGSGFPKSASHIIVVNCYNYYNY